MEWKTGVIVVEGPHLVTEHKLTDRVLIASGTGQQMTFNLNIPIATTSKMSSLFLHKISTFSSTSSAVRQSCLIKLNFFQHKADVYLE